MIVNNARNREPAWKDWGSIRIPNYTVASINKRTATSLVRAALTDEAWFGDGLPTWHKAPIAEGAVLQTLAAVKRLRKFRKQFVGAARLANELEECSPGCRCGSGACPKCLRAIQRFMVHHIMRITQSKREGVSQCVLALSLVSPESRAAVGRLSTLDVGKLTEHALDAIQRTSCDWCVFGIDISLNDDTAKEAGLSWVVQHYGFVGFPSLDQQTRTDVRHRLLERFPRSNTVPRPVRVRTFDCSAYGISYFFKTAFVRRIAYRYFKHGLSSWNTRKVKLRAKQHVELLMALDHFGAAARVGSVGIKAIR